MPLPSGEVSNATEVRSPFLPAVKAPSSISLTKLGECDTFKMLVVECKHRDIDVVASVEHSCYVHRFKGRPSP